MSTLNFGDTAAQRSGHVRRLCLEMAGVTEKLSHGEAAWFVGGKQFATTADHHHDDRLSVWLAARPLVQDDFIEDDPKHFFRPPYVGHRGWLGVYLDTEDVDWDVVAKLVRNAYEIVNAAHPKGGAEKRR